MKPWQFYTLTVIGICLIALTGAISYSLYNLSIQIADVTRLPQTGSQEKISKRPIKYEYRFRALYKKDFYDGKEEPLISPNSQKDLDFFGWDYAGTLFDDGRWIFVLMKRNI